MQSRGARPVRQFRLCTDRLTPTWRLPRVDALHGRDQGEQMRVSARLAATGNRFGVAGNTGVTMFAVCRVPNEGDALSFRRATIALLGALVAISAFLIISSSALAAPPTVATPVISDVSYASARAQATVNPGGFAIYEFEKSTNGSAWSPVEPIEPKYLFGENDQTIESVLSNLKGSTNYFIRLHAFNFVGDNLISDAPHPSFTTLAVEPPTIIATDGASNIFSRSATVTGTVKRPANPDPAFNISDCRFEYLSDAEYGVERSEVQELSVQASGGSFQLSYQGAKTSQIAFDASAAAVQAELEELAGIPSGSLSVSGGPGDEAGSSPYVITFGGLLSNQDVPLLGSDGAELDGDVTGINAISSTQGRSSGFAGAAEAKCDQLLPFETPEGENEVSGHITNLEPSTTYHVRLTAENASPSAASLEATSTFNTAAKVAAPSVLTTDEASDLDYFSATVSGAVQRPAGADPALDTSCRFEYVSDGNFDDTGFEGAASTPCIEAPEEAPITNTDPAPVSAHLTGLADGTTYHLRLTATNGGGTDFKDAPATFTTLAVVNPSLDVDPASEIGYTSFRASGTVDPGNQGTYPVFEYAPVGTDEWVGTLAGNNGLPFMPPNSPAQVLSVDFPCDTSLFWGGCAGRLKPGTTYQYRIGASIGNSGLIATYSSPYEEFTTLGTSTPPSVSCDPVAGITPNSAHFNCEVDTNAPAGPLPDDAADAYRTEWRLECTPSCPGPGGGPLGGTVEAEEGNASLSVTAKRLDPHTHYEFKLIAENALATVETTSDAFDTPLVKPAVKATPGASDGTGGYILQATVNPNGSEVTDCRFEWGPSAPNYAFSVDCSPMPGAGAKPITVEAHLTGLTPGVTYHYNVLATNEAGEAESTDSEFTPALNLHEPCDNEEERRENHSLALPECRAYEMVTPPGKEGFSAGFATYDEGVRVLYATKAGNIANSGYNGLTQNFYVAGRSAAGWKTIPNLNGESGSIFADPNNFDPFGTAQPLPRKFSKDLLSSLWVVNKAGSTVENFYLRNPDGTFTMIGAGEVPGTYSLLVGGTSDDLSHVFITSNNLAGGVGATPPWGPGVYEYVGTANESPPRRVDVDNSGGPITTCNGFSGGLAGSARAAFNSADGRVVVFRTAGGCGGSNPASEGLWARVGGTASFEISESRCDRSSGDPCNAAAPANFAGAATDGSRVFFTTTQQLLDSDTDGVKDLYACDLPSGSIDPLGGRANPCAALRRVSAGDSAGALVEKVNAVSADGSSVLFISKGALAANEDSFGEVPASGDHNLYLWRTNATHPDGEVDFIASLDSDNDLSNAQFTPDGDYLAFTATSRILGTDTDDARDAYWYSASAEELIRTSTNVFGVAGNGGSYDAIVGSSAISDDGSKLVFSTSEPLSPVDGNAELDVYLWTPDRVSLISTGSVGGGVAEPAGTGVTVLTAIDGSGQNIYFQTAGALSPADGDELLDAYDARIGGGFSFAERPSCSGEGCQPPVSRVPKVQDPGTSQQISEPPLSKTCPKGRIRRHGVCVRKPCPDKKIRRHRKCVKKHQRKHAGSGRNSEKPHRTGSRAEGN